MAAILFALQTANWQRGGGKGARPVPVKRPVDGPPKRRKGRDPMTPDDLKARRAAMRDELARRRAKEAG